MLIETTDEASRGNEAGVFGRRQNIVEQDHRAILRIVRPMLGFKTFRCVRALIGGIETMHMIRKGRLNTPESQASSVASSTRWLFKRQQPQRLDQANQRASPVTYTFDKVTL